MSKTKKSPGAPLIIPFSTMDEAMMHADTLRHHSNVHVEVRAPGKLDAERMRKAVKNAMHDHPMTRARQAEHKPSDRDFHWEITPEASIDPLLVVEAGGDSAVVRRREQLLNMQPPLHDSPPFYVWLVRRTGGDSLIFNINHAVGDGIGALHLLRSVVNNYAGIKDPKMVDPIAIRETAIIASGNNKERKQKQQNQMEIMRRNLSTAASIAPDCESDRRGCGCHHLTITNREFKRLKPRKHVDATVNDLLLAAMHKTIELWNVDHGVDTKLVRVQTPVNLRPPEWQYEVMGNYIGSFPTNSVVEERHSAAELVAAIFEQTQNAKETGFAEVMYTAMQFQSKVPIFVKEMFMPGLLSSSSTSACVSNLGRVSTELAFGIDKTATETWVSPPAVLPARVGLGALGHGGSLFLAFRYANDTLDAKAAQRFVKTYREALHWLS